MNDIHMKTMSGYQRTEFDRDTEEEDEDKSIPNVTYKNVKNNRSTAPDSFSNGFSNANFLNDGSALLTPGSHEESTWSSDQASNLRDQPLNPVHPIVGPRLNATSLDEERGIGSNQPRVTFLSRNGIVCFVSSKLNANKNNNNNERKRRPPTSVLFAKLSFFERLILYVLAMSFVVIILLTSLLFHSVSYFHHLLVVTNSSADRYCVTPSCVTVAAAIINAMDTTTDPCEDFYTYSCGGWIKSNPLPDGKSIWGSFNKLWQENQLVMKNVLDDEGDKLHQDLSSAEIKARSYYLSCLDKNDTIESRGAGPLKSFIREIGGWNITGDFDETKWSFQKSIEVLHNKYNRGGGLISWAVGTDERNSSFNTLQIDQSGLILPSREYYLNSTVHEKVLNAYLDYMTQVGILLGGEGNSTRHQMEQVLELEIKIANITIPAEDRRDDEQLYHKYKLKHLMKIAPFIDWISYFNFAFNQINHTITEEEPIVVYSPAYLTNVSLLIEEYNSTPEGRTVLANYFGWSVAHSLCMTLSKDFRDAAKILRRALIGSEGSETPWRYCVSDTNNVMGFSLGAMFVKSVFKGESKEMARLMIEEIKDAFKDNLPNLKWMDAETRKLAKEKAEAITDMIGFPDFILDPKKLDEKYEGLDFDEMEYFENNVRVNKFTLSKNLEKILKPANKSEWEMTPPAVNAYYAPTKNQIVFPAGILQAPFYDINYPKSLNFGAMGVVMGHELTHAFDDQGREYDKEGNLHKWWKNSTSWNFVERIQCFIYQYSNYSIEGVNLNGRQTLGENIADNGGLKAAYHAYETWLESHPKELPLPGVNLTDRQLFFMGFSQVWCSVNTPEASKLQTLNDPHSPGIFRVIGTLSNSPEFAQQFNCPKGSRMNPVDKCDVW